MDQLRSALALPGADAPSFGRARALMEAGALGLAYVRGDRQAALASLEEAVSIARGVGDHRLLVRGLEGLAQAVSDAADYPRATALYAEILALSRAADDPTGIATALYYLAVIARLQGDRPRAAALYEESLAIRRTLGTRHGIAEALRGLGDLARLDGYHARATRLYKESLSLTAELGDVQCSVGTLEGLAMLTAAQRLWARSVRLHAAAAALREQIGAPVPAARRAEMDAGLVSARAALGEAGFAAAWTEGPGGDLGRAVEFALAEYDLPPDSARPSYPDGLTAREVEVVRLVARGLSDRQVAGELFISPKTVDHHLRRIFRKVNVANRAGLAAYAAQRGLVG